MSTTHAPIHDAELTRFLADEQPRLVRTLASYTGDRDLAEELAAEALARMVRDWSTVGLMDAPGAYAHRTAINLANSWFRRRAAHRRALARRGPETEVHHDPDTVAHLAVREAVAALPAQQRAAVSLHYLGGFSTGEVASALGVAEGTVRSNLHHARATLRDLLDDVAAVDGLAGDVRVDAAEVLGRGRTLARRRVAAQAVAAAAAVLAVLVGSATLAGVGRPDTPIIAPDDGVEEGATPVPGTYADGAVVVGTLDAPPTLDLTGSTGLTVEDVAAVPGSNPVLAIGADGTVGALRGGQLELRLGDTLLASTDVSALVDRDAAGPDAPGTVAVDGQGRVLLLAGAPGEATVVALTRDGTVEVLLDGAAAPGAGTEDLESVHLAVGTDGVALVRVVRTRFDAAAEVVRSTSVEAPVDDLTAARPGPTSELPLTDTRAVNGGQVGAGGGVAGLVYEGRVVLAVPGATLTGTVTGLGVGAVDDPGPRDASAVQTLGAGTGALYAAVQTDGGLRGLVVAARADGYVVLVDLGPVEAGERPEVVVGADGAVHLARPVQAGGRQLVRLLDASFQPVER